MSIGMNATTGQALTDMDHLRQSINQILSTPIGSRIERRLFGSLLPELIDGPLNEHTVIQLYAATATALATHEPRLRLNRVQMQTAPESRSAATVQIDGTTYLDGRARAVSVSVPVFKGSV